jgi:hypothetical protein
MLPGLAAYHRDIMGRSQGQIAAHKTQAIAFVQERYGVVSSA